MKETMEFKRKSDYIVKRYPNADKKHLYKMLGILLKDGKNNRKVWRKDKTIEKN